MTAASEPESRPAPAPRALWAVLLLVFAIYAPTIGNGYAMDDEPIVSSRWVQDSTKPDPMITRGDGESWIGYLGKFFVNHYWQGESNNDGLYRPITVASYGLVYQLLGRHFEREEWPQHFVNVLLNVYAVWLVFVLLVRLRASALASVWGALLFGVHALHSEVVAGVVGRAELFAFCFGAQATIWLLGRRLRPLLAGLFFLLAFGSKESALSWLPFFFCCQLARAWRAHPEFGLRAALPWRELRTPLLVLGGAVLVYGIGRWNTFRLDPPMQLVADYSSNPFVGLPVVERWLSGITVWGYGLLVCFVPYQMSVVYGPLVFGAVVSPADPMFLSAAVALLGFLVAGLWFARRIPLLFLGMACFLGFSFLISNVPLPIGTVFGDRLYFIPSLGICMLVAPLWERLRGRGRQLFVIVAACWCVGNVAMAVHRGMLWRSSWDVFSHDLKQFPQSIDLQRKVATCLAIDGPEQDLPGALRHLEHAKKLYPDFVHAYRDTAKIYRTQRRWGEAIAEYEAALKARYVEPPGVEGVSWEGIGDCRIGLSKAATGAERERWIRGALTAYLRVLSFPVWGDSHRKALRKIFEHADRRLPRQRIAALYDQARKIVGEDHKLTVQMGVAAYRVGLPPDMVLRPLGWVIQNMPQAQRTRDYWLAHMIYADALLAARRGSEAQQVLQMLLQRPELTATEKAGIRKQLAEDPNLQR